MFGISADVEVAIVGASAVVASALIPYVFNRKSNKAVEKKIGDPNGYQSLVGMIEVVLRLSHANTRKIEHHDEVLERLEWGQAEMKKAMDRVLNNQEEPDGY